MAAHAAETVEFLRAIVAVFANPLPQTHRQPRLHQVIPVSTSYIYHLKRACLKAGVIIHVSIVARHLVQASGRVTGVEATGVKGALRTILAAKGVILASADIAGNVALLKTHIVEGLDGIEELNPWCTGDGHNMGVEAGAQIISRPDYGAGPMPVLMITGVPNLIFFIPRRRFPRWPNNSVGTRAPYRRV